MKVEASSVVMAGQCEIRSAKCTAADHPGPITAVWELPGRRQINVCRACLEEMVRIGEWQISGSKIPERFDIQVLNDQGKRVLLVEVKKIPLPTVERAEWATRVHRNLRMHGSLPYAPYFLLAAWPGPFYLWSDGDQTEDTPQYRFNVDKEIKSILGDAARNPSEDKLVDAIARWIGGNLKKAPHTGIRAFDQSGLSSLFSNSAADIKVA